MRKLAIVVFVATALVALPPRATADLRPVALVEGQGLFGALACGACAAAFVGMTVNGFGPVYAALINARDGLLGRACISACTS